MHVLIINGSPRVQKYSNTEKIIAAFAKGLSEAGSTFEAHAISDRKTWDIVRDAYMKNDEILIALPLYVECVPGLLLEFLETLPKKDERTRLSFLLQSGFAEGCQLRCGEAFLEKLPEYFPLPMRLLIGLIPKTLAKNVFQKAAASLGCSTPLDAKIWD